MAAPGQAAGPPASSNVRERIPRDPQLDGIASRIVTADSSEAVKFKRSLSRPLRTRVLTSADEDDEDVPASSEGLKQNIVRPNGWYSKVQDSLAAIAALFVISFIRATYGDKAYAHNPDKRLE